MGHMLIPWPEIDWRCGDFQSAPHRDAREETVGHRLLLREMDLKATLIQQSSQELVIPQKNKEPTRG
ncbi:MAG: hypothetical protein ACPL7D_02590, partial [Candidatus Sumerlaeaceae bacterium]